MLDVYYFGSAETSNTDGIGIDLVVDLVNGNCESTGLLAAVRRYSRYDIRFLGDLYLDTDRKLARDGC